MHFFRRRKHQIDLDQYFQKDQIINIYDMYFTFFFDEIKKLSKNCEVERLDSLVYLVKHPELDSFIIISVIDQIGRPALSRSLKEKLLLCKNIEEIQEVINGYI